MSSPYDAPLAAVAHGLDDLRLIDPTYRTVTEKQQALVGLSRLIARAEAERMRVLAAADDIAEETGARSTAEWLAVETREAIGPARRALALGQAIDQRWQQVGAAMSSGDINADQVVVMVEALDRLPKDLDPELRGKAEAHLIGEAASVRTT